MPRNRRNTTTTTTEPAAPTMTPENAVARALLNPTGGTAALPADAVHIGHVKAEGPAGTVTFDLYRIGSQYRTKRTTTRPGGKAETRWHKFSPTAAGCLLGVNKTLGNLTTAGYQMTPDASWLNGTEFGVTAPQATPEAPQDDDAAEADAA